MGKKKPKPHFVGADFNHPPALASELGEVRGMIMGQLNKVPMPNWMIWQPHPQEPKLIFTNRRNGKSIEIGLCDSFGAKEILQIID